MPTYDLSGPAGTLIVSGKPATIEMIEALQSGDVEWTTSSVSEVTLRLEDRRREILRSGLVDPGRADGSIPGSPLSVGGHMFEVRALEHTTDGVLVVQARSALVAKLKRNRGRMVTSGPITPASWIGKAVTTLGGSFIGQPGPTRPQITRQVNESDWDVAMRLAREEGALCFEYDGTVVFGKPSWLVTRSGATPFVVNIVDGENGVCHPDDERIFTRPAPRRSSDSSEVCEWSVDVDAELATGMALGSPIKLSGYAPFDGTYLLDSIKFPLDSEGVATLHATIPVDPEKQTTGSQASGGKVSSRTTVAVAPAGRYGGTNLSAAQMANAAAIIKVGIAMGIPVKGLVIAIATALQESTLKNIRYGDRDSVGLFQQRPSQGWGTIAQIMDPQYAARKFFEALLKVRGWESMAVTVAAQKVQRSAFPNAYAKWEDEARAIVAATVRTVSTPAPSSGQSAGGVAGLDSRTSKVIAFARAQIGKPYIWGGTGPRGYDCSGLTQAAWRAAGVEITRTTHTQLANPRLQRISRSQLRPGDLIYPHSGHVQLYIGNGRIIEARKTGTPILESGLWGLNAGSQYRRVP